MLKLIDNLQSNSKCHFIDYLPVKMEEATYFEIEEYFLETYLHDFSERITRIVIKLIGYYPSKIYLTEFPEESTDKFKNIYPVGENMRNKPLFELAKVITHIIQSDLSSVQIILGSNSYSVISINGGFSVDIYNATDEQLQLLEMLVMQESLFLKQAE